MTSFFRSIPRHLKSSVLSLARHIVMSLSSASAVTVTLLLFSAFLLLAGNIGQFTQNVKSDFRIHVTVTADVADQKNIDVLKTKLLAVDQVDEVEISTKEQELELFIEEKGEEFALYREDNPLHEAFFVSVKNADLIETVTQDILKIEGIDNAVYGGDSVSQMVDILNTVRFSGIIFVTLLTFLAIFLISNTIKMAIYARNEEISIMRNVGATNGYIKMPFMLEGMFIGMIGAIIPCLVTYFGYSYLYSSLGGQLVSNVFALEPVMPFAITVCLTLIISGAAVGVLGSFWSVTKYLKWKR